MHDLLYLSCNVGGSIVVEFEILAGSSLADKTPVQAATECQPVAWKSHVESRTWTITFIFDN